MYDEKTLGLESLDKIRPFKMRLPKDVGQSEVYI